MGAAVVGAAVVGAAVVGAAVVGAAVVGCAVSFAVTVKVAPVFLSASYFVRSRRRVISKYVFCDL